MRPIHLASVILPLALIATFGAGTLYTILETKLRYHEITSPVVIVVGDHDRPERESIPLSKQIPGAELVLIPRTGHLIPHVRPQAVITAIDAVAARGPAARGPNRALKAPAER